MSILQPSTTVSIMFQWSGGNDVMEINVDWKWMDVISNSIKNIKNIMANIRLGI